MEKFYNTHNLFAAALTKSMGQQAFCTARGIFS